jgi:pilus assembly protein Flp/PilA
MIETSESIEKERIAMLKSFAAGVKKFIVSEDGPTAVEYAVMLALIVIVCLTAVTAIGTKASSTFQKAADALPT